MGKQRAGTLDALARYDAMVAEGHVMPKSLQTMAENLRNNSYAKDAKQVFKSKQLDEYVAAVNRFLGRGGTTRQIIEKVGVIQSEDGTDILKLARRGGKETDKNPYGLSLRGSREGTNTNLNRKLNEEVPLKYRSHFKNDADWKRYKKYIKQGNVSNEKLTPKGFHKGHTTSISIVEASHDPLAQRLESATGNMSTGAKYDIPRERLQAAGTPTTWEESIDQFKNPRKYKKFRILTPQDKQRIYSGENPDDVFSQRKAAIRENPLASGKRGNIRTQERLNHPGKNLNLKISKRALRLGIPAVGGLVAALSIGDAHARGIQAEETGYWLDHVQANIANIEAGADTIGAVPNPLSVYAEPAGLVSGLANLTIDLMRTKPTQEIPESYGRTRVEMSNNAKPDNSFINWVTGKQTETDRFIQGRESGEEISPKDSQKLQQYREYRAGGGDAAVSEGMTRKQVIELGQGNLRVKDRGIQQRADKSGLSFLEQELYEAGGGKKKQGDNRLSMQQVMEIGQKNLTVQDEQLRLNYLF